MERINQDSKQENPTSLHGTSDKAKALVRKGKGKSNKITNTFKVNVLKLGTMMVSGLGTRLGIREH